MSIRIQLEPLGATVEVERGAPLRDVLFAHGVEFPCGGRGSCKRCRVRVLKGALPPSADEAAILTREDLAAGWRLACRARAEADLTLDIAQWETTILADDTAFAFEPAQGVGIAVDLGTTTLVAQALDLATARVLAVRTALNPQAAHGSDVMSRVQLALREDGRRRLMELIRAEVGRLAADGTLVTRVVIVGNTVMHHLFCGIDVSPLSQAPFTPSEDGLKEFSASDLGWELPGNPQVLFLPCLGGFVGSDILAGILAARVAASDAPVGLIDLGTNGEIVIGNRERILCASTAAGPAFEGGLISMGMRASTGAIAEVRLSGGRLECRTLGNAPPRGICGSGLVDAVAAGLELGAIQPNGRLADRGSVFPLTRTIALTQGDIREVQLAKAAIAAGIRILLARWNLAPGDLKRVYLAGAFGNYINRASARRIGLVDFLDDVIEPAGNTALLGAKLALFEREDLSFGAIRKRIEHIRLAADPDFQDRYVDSMRFPEQTGGS